MGFFEEEFVFLERAMFEMRDDLFGFLRRYQVRGENEI